MTSSLQQQLQQLAAPQTNVYSRQKDKRSLLFDRDDCSALSRDAFFKIGESDAPAVVLAAINANSLIAFLAATSCSRSAP